jgi:hypothetical protein
MSRADVQMSDSPNEGNNQHGVPPETPLQVFQSITMIDVLEQDARPAFVLDLENNNTGNRLNFVVQNRALRTAGLENVLAGVVPPDTYGQSAHLTYAAFKNWALNCTTQRDHSFLYHGMTWTSMDVNVRWRMVTGMKERQQERMTGAFAKAAWGSKAIPVVPSEYVNLSFLYTLLTCRDFLTLEYMISLMFIL